jgi:hypothetical protein
MAQVNVQYPALNQLFGAQSVMPAYYGTQQMMAAEESEKINQQQALQDTLFRAQDQEYDLKTKQAGLDQSAALLPGMQADAAGKVRTNAVRQGVPVNDEIAAAAKTLANQLKGEDLKALDYEADFAVKSRDPKEQERGKQLMMLSRAVVTEQAKASALADREEKKIRMQGENSLAVARVNAASRENTASARGTGSAPKSLPELLRGQSPQQASMVYMGLALEADNNGQPDKAAFYRQQAQDAMMTAQTNMGIQAEARKIGGFDNASTGMATIQAKPAPGLIQSQPQNPGATTPMPQASDETVFKKAFGGYDPDKYMYRMGPNGIPQRKAK